MVAGLRLNLSIRRVAANGTNGQANAVPDKRGPLKQRTLWLVSVALLILAGCSPRYTTSTRMAEETSPRSTARPDTPAAGPGSFPTASRNPTRQAIEWWQPLPGMSWQWQLDGTDIDPALDVEMYDIDLFDSEAGRVADLHAEGRKVVCYLNAGAWEDWRADAGEFPDSVLGKEYDGWPGERWLDIRRIDLLAPVMGARLDQCQAKGFDGVEPDNIDGYTSDTGFPLTYDDQLAYNVWLSDEAHVRGLSIGLKNDDEQVEDLLPYFDWALTEDCFAQEWCDEVSPFVRSGKAVFAAEYTDEIGAAEFLKEVCPRAAAMGFSAILKDRDLGTWRLDCR